MGSVRKDISDDTDYVLMQTTSDLAGSSVLPSDTFICYPDRLPSHQNVHEIISLLWKINFPELFFPSELSSAHIDSIRTSVSKIFELLNIEISRLLSLMDDRHTAVSPSDEVSGLTRKIIGSLPELKRLLYTDIHAIRRADPAAHSEAEIILCYPGLKAMLHHRFANLLFRMGIPLLPRIISEIAHSRTGIDIHPGARIGEYFAIDHGTGIVIGETCRIGNNVTIYQGVTLGAKNFRYDKQGRPQKFPRHPLIEDNVTIYSNATVLGRITIGRNSIIGGNVWITADVPPDSKIVQNMPRNESFSGGAGI